MHGRLRSMALMHPNDFEDEPRVSGMDRDWVRLQSSFSQGFLTNEGGKWGTLTFVLDLPLKELRQ